MTVLVDSLKKQNAFLQGEVERFADGVELLAGQLAQAQARITALEQQVQAMEVEIDANEGVIIAHEAAPTVVGDAIPVAEQRV